MTLNEIIMDLADLVPDLSKIEIHDEPTVVRRAISDIRGIETKLKAFKQRLMYEIRSEVLEAHERKPKAKPRGVPFEKKKEE
ncbi:MAG: hypothetical protein COB15_09700 [Flavobacteriales bacterium]|nr:MAG: hypothetical protein COB15_09700 [Flavobacteriales bacterium]